VRNANFQPGLRSITAQGFGPNALRLRRPVVTRPGQEIQGCFYRGIYQPPAEPLFELHLASDWRKRRPRQG